MNKNILLLTALFAALPLASCKEKIESSSEQKSTIEEKSSSVEESSSSIEESSSSIEESSIVESSSSSDIFEISDYHINFESFEDGVIANGTQIGKFSTISTEEKALNIGSASEGVTVNEVTYSKYLKTGGSSSTKAGSEYRVVKFETTGKGTVKVVARTGSIEGEERSIYVYQVENGVEQDKVVVNDANVYELTFHYGGTFYLGTTNNIQIFDIEVNYEDGVNEDWEPPISLSNPLELKANDLPARTFQSNVEFDNFTINAKATDDKQDVIVDSNSKSYDGVSYSQRIKLGGKGNYDYRSVTIKTSGQARITIVCMSSNSSTATQGSLFNTSYTMDDPNALVGSSAEVATSIGAYVFNVDQAGAYCFTSTGEKGINIYNIIIEYAE